MTRWRTPLILATITALMCALGVVERIMYEATGWCWPTVTDGDTLDGCGLWAAPIRLHGIAAPERFTDDGKLATAALVEIIDGGWVRCVPTGARTWGRDVAVCWREGQDIGAMLVALGRARNCPGYGGTYTDTAEGERLMLPDYCEP